MNVCGTNSHNRRAKRQPGVGVVKILCDSDSSGSKSFRLHSPDKNTASVETNRITWRDAEDGLNLLLWFSDNPAGVNSR